ncbi:MAG TPA: CHAD domain-containing protein, partial [Candidatus Polarisedimenticolaceae bacterium]|nr:CHAD domain-containing protein [Candidatus Polarisedimenticolaceae bacterium]
RLDDRVRTKGARLVVDLEKLTPNTDEDTLHRIRRRIRRFRYAAEIAAKIPEGATSTHRGWRRAQNELGEIQDRRVLAAWLEAWSREKLRRRRPAARTAARLAAATLRAEADALQAELASGSIAAAVAEALGAMAPEVQREVGGGVPFPKVHPAITLISG